MNLKPSFLTFMLAILLISPVFGQESFKPAPTSIKGLIQVHFQSIQSEDAEKFASTVNRSFFPNDTLIWLKKNVNLSYKSVLFDGETKTVLVKMNNKVGKRMPYDLLNKSAMKSKLVKLKINPTTCMAFRVEKVKGEPVINMAAIR